jgi:hypothetical protein
VDLDEEDVGELVEAERVYLDNLHRSNPRSGTRLIHLPRGVLPDHTLACGGGAGKTGAHSCPIVVRRIPQRVAAAWFRSERVVVEGARLSVAEAAARSAIISLGGWLKPPW